ncbi:Acyl-homoserine lactone acylase quiP precursor [Delftia tsuruhatensis]|uniref:penicillin acylase family protein n=1 Tax=Delftia tsuruhatensis TaxID=180282 RepID=UPI001E75DB4D|nr:penicillin acylase family protein [Delftia tsuruhatensis]CAB5708148.1 Acyl-homoserine lactone acylase quiP precursor [Delftia tsuruhatensis]CAC9680632.1 Acyl-homoserine lactone acylase quiP precursor [Delftia tsuruhatensis]
MGIMRILNSRWWTVAAVGAVGTALLAGSALAIYAVRVQPALDGQLTLAGLEQPVRVRRDDADITHISAYSPQDLWRALGHVHAQERGWQLEFNRRLMHGTLSEILGPATLDTDKLMRALDIRGAARRQYASLSASAREALQAYSEGIAAFYAALPMRHHPLGPEFMLLDTVPGGGDNSAWAPEDSVGWALMMALDLGGNWGNEFARLAMLSRLDTQQLWQLMPAYPGEAPATATDLAALYRGLGVYRKDAQAQAASGMPVQAMAAADDLDDAWSRWSRDMVRDAGTNDGKGSNNWVLSGSRTASGKPLLANDPHLGLSAPAIWYYARLQSPAGQAQDGTPLSPIDVVGATLPGLPFVVLGRTREVAWGFTNTNPDVQDLYLEQIDPADAGRYRTPEGWQAFAVRSERIKVKGRPDVQLTLRSTRHGPVISDVQPQYESVLDKRRYAVALRWAALDTDNLTVQAGLRANEARTVAQLFEAFADYHSPMQSIVAADVHGAMGFKAAGRVPLRAADNDLRGVAPAPGWDARYDWQGWLPYDQTPQDDGAARGFVATANQRVTAPDYAHFLTQDWSLPYRHQRITDLIEARPRHDVASMAAIQNDQTSLAARALLVPLLKALDEAPASHPLAAQARQVLARFDGHMHAGQAAPLIFAAWVDELTRGLVIPRIGTQVFAATYGKRDYRAGIEGILERRDAWWCAPQGCAAQVGQAMDRALARLQAGQGGDMGRWAWGRAHPALSSHRPLGAVALLSGVFNVSVPSGGDSYTVNVGQYLPGDAAAPFANRHAASLRAIYDLADPERSLFIYQTGQSGLALSSRYADMSAEWAGGRYRPLQMAPARWRHSMMLRPQ